MTHIQRRILAVTAMVSVFMYIDRVCLSQVRGEIERELQLSDSAMEWVLSAFFWAYAVAQVPAGFLVVRFGPRVMLAVLLFLWSAFTFLTGCVWNLESLFLIRLLVGVAEAGAYPAAATLLKSTFPPSSRGLASSIVTLGGRAGGAMGQRLTPWFVVMLLGITPIAPWRVVLMLFGITGMIWAFCFYRAVPKTENSPVSVPSVHLPLKRLITFPAVWLLSFLLFGINFAWAFVITQFPKYLEKVHQVSENDRGFYASLPLFAGLPAMLLGGFITDALVRRWGVRWGRAIPLAVATLLGAVAYAGCTLATTPLQVTLLLCLMTIGVDLGLPSVWAFAQDVGGRYVAPVLGWANMCGNLGAALCPILMGLIQREAGWAMMFAAGAAAMLFAAIIAVLLRADRPIHEPAAGQPASI
ncbi:MAG: MFS transporter [Gemmataceae bacterium]